MLLRKTSTKTTRTARGLQTPNMAGKILNLGIKGSPRDSRNPHKTRPHREKFHACKHSQAISSLAPQSPSFPNPSFQTLSPSTSPPNLLNSSPSTMSLEVSTELRTWLTRHGLTGYLNVYDAAAHPRAQAITTKIHPSTITNDIICSALHLPRG